MSCSKCDGDNAVESYVRIGNANVTVIGCVDHLCEIISNHNEEKTYKELIKRVACDMIDPLPDSDKVDVLLQLVGHKITGEQTDKLLEILGYSTKKTEGGNEHE